MDAVLPIDGRVGHIGGIESVTVDGVRWYFGFDYSSDLVVSPLVDDAGVMSVFAAEHLRQRDGAHDAAFWRDLVDASVEGSDLIDSDEDRQFTGELLAAQRLRPGYHLRYLLGAASGWDDSFFGGAAVGTALSALRVGEDDRDWDCIDTCIAGLEDPYTGTRTAATLVMTRYVNFVLDAAPANWPHVFAALREEAGPDA